MRVVCRAALTRGAKVARAGIERRPATHPEAVNAQVAAFLAAQPR